MAHFARIEDGRVVGLHAVRNIDMMTEYGIEIEEKGIDNLQQIHGFDKTFKQCSIKTSRGVHREGRKPLRKNYPAIGWHYDQHGDFFYPPRPTDRNDVECSSWVLNSETGHWDPPIPEPEQPSTAVTDDTERDENQLKYYAWDESVYQSDNTQGWVLV